MRRLAKYTKGYRPFIIITPICITCEVLLDIRIPRIMGYIVDNGIPAKDVAYVTSQGTHMILLALIAMSLGMVSNVCSSKGVIGTAANLRNALFGKIQQFSFSNVDHFQTASLVTRMTTDVNNTINAFILMIRMLTRSLVQVVFATFMAFQINSRLCVVFLVAIPILVTVISIVLTKSHPLFRAMLRKYDALNASVQENLISMRVVKSFVREEYEKEKFQKANDELKQMAIRAERIIIINQPVMTLTVYVCIVSVLWFGGNMIIAGDMLTGELISFISYISQILMSLMMISMAFMQIVISRASRQRIFEVLDEVETFTDEGNDPELKMEDGSVEFDHVYFKYSDEAEKYVLNNIRLRIESGETVGIIGGTGTGKTSLVQLIPRLYEATRGEVFVGGHNVKEYTFDELRNNVSMVLQKNLLFSGSIIDNLRWGDPDATDEQIRDACKKACADEFIESFPDGYETDLGQGGVNVSGGQKQRLCIARALLKNPKILILDDSTSAVDTATEKKIRNYWETEHPEMTKIIIAQRITSVMEADKIVVMDNGHIDEIGTHESLLEHNSIYQEVYNSQQQGEE